MKNYLFFLQNLDDKIFYFPTDLDLNVALVVKKYNLKNSIAIHYNSEMEFMFEECM